MKKKFIGFITAAFSAAYLMSFNALSAFAESGDSASSDTAAAGGSVFWTLVFPLLIMFALLYFVAIRPQKKHEQEMKDMQGSLEVGDEIVTGGGIVGIIVAISDDTVLVETGGSRNKLRIKKWAINENVTAAERAKEAKAAADKKAKTGLAAAGLADTDSDDKKKKKKKDE